MGDKFENIQNSSINNRSKINQARKGSTPQNNSSSELEDIRLLIQEGKLENAMQEFELLLKKTPKPQIEDSILSLQGRFYRLKRDNQQGVLTDSRLREEENHILKSLIEIYRTLKPS